MQELYKFRVVLFFLSLSFSFPTAGISQVQTPRYISTSMNSHGFYEYLPAGYATGSKKYPLMIFIHGVGELGNGVSDLPKVLRNGPPKLINNGSFPTSFTVKGSTFSFIVISPQFVNIPGPRDIDSLMMYINSHYRVDTKRIYLTGLSMGGGNIWNWAGINKLNADKLAGLIPVAGAFEIGAYYAKNIALSNLPVFATHNLNDPTVPSSYTVNNVNLINSSIPPPSPRAYDTIFNASGHDAWTKTYNPATIFSNGLNVYQWMLQYSRGISAPLPVTMTDYKATLSSDNSRVTVSWATAIEENNKYFILQRSANGRDFKDLDTIPAADPSSAGHQYADIDPNPLNGDNYYRLTQEDIDGKTTLYGILKVTVSTQKQAQIRLSPNPATGSTLYLELAYPELGATAISLSDLNGRILRAWQFRKEGAVLTQYLDISNLPPGNYFIKVQGTTMRAVQQFIKE